VNEIDQFVDGCFDAFAAAQEQSTTHDFTLRLAGHTIAVHYASPSLVARFCPTLEHLEVEPTDDVELTIGCWEHAATGVLPPPPPWSLDHFLARGRVRGHVDGPVRVAYDSFARVLSVFDRTRDRAVLYSADATLVPHWFDRAPFRTILTWWAADHGLPFLHASAVADDSGAVAIAGASGAGKSTTALSCLAAGLRLLGDDACAVRLDPSPSAYSVYGRAKLELDSLARLPTLASMIVDEHEGQTLIDPGDRRAESAPLRAVLLPRITDGTTSRRVRIPESAAVRALLASAVHEGVGIVGGMLATLADLARDVPCFALELGSDLDGVVATVCGALHEPR
jgi:hypothetical protein